MNTRSWLYAIARPMGDTAAIRRGGVVQRRVNNPHAWFTCFAPAASPQVAVGVIVLNGGSLANEATGGAIAAPIARDVIAAALGLGQ